MLYTRTLNKLGEILSTKLMNNLEVEKYGQISYLPII